MRLELLNKLIKCNYLTGTRNHELSSSASTITLPCNPAHGIPREEMFPSTNVGSYIDISQIQYLLDMLFRSGEYVALAPSLRPHRAGQALSDLDLLRIISVEFLSDACTGSFLQ
jgi:hypothetical protein